MLMNLRWAASMMILTALGGPVSADVITDWNEKAVAFVTKQRLLPPQAERVIASVHLAMFDAVNSIGRDGNFSCAATGSAAANIVARKMATRADTWQRLGISTPPFAFRYSRFPRAAIQPMCWRRWKPLMPRK